MRLNEYDIKPKHVVGLMLLLMGIAVWLLIATSCKVVEREVPVILHERDSVIRVQQYNTHDTLMLRDSVFHYVKGDTVLIERWHHLQANNRVVRTDTVVREQRVEVPVEVTTIKEVNRLNWWQKSLSIVGASAIIMLIALALWRIKT